MNYFTFRYIFPKCGTPGFVAPEIANLVDKTIKYDKKCDIFSAGVIFFKLYYYWGGDKFILITS